MPLSLTTLVARKGENVVEKGNALFDTFTLLISITVSIKVSIPDLVLEKKGKLERIQIPIQQ